MQAPESVLLTILQRKPEITQEYPDGDGKKYPGGQFRNTKLVLGREVRTLRVIGISCHHTSTGDHPRIMCQVRKEG